MIEVVQRDARQAGTYIERLFEAHERRLGQFPVHVVRDRALAEDLLQETFLAAWNARDPQAPRAGANRAAAGGGAMTTVHDTDDRRVEELLAPLADIPPVPYRDRRAPARRNWLRPALVASAFLVVVVVAGAAILTSGSGTPSQPAATSPAPVGTISATAPTVSTPPPTTSTPAPTTSAVAPPATTSQTTVPAAPELGVWFVQDGRPVRVPTPDAGSGPGAERRALEALLAGPPSGYASKVRAGTQLEAFEIADTIATIRLSGPAPEGVALEQIVATVTDGGAVQWVRLGDEPGLVDRAIAAGKDDVAAAPIEVVRATAAGDGTVEFAGTADVFEATLQLELLEDGRSLAKQVVTATCGTGCRGSFAGSIAAPGVHVDAASGKVVGPDGAPVVLRADWLSAKDGSVQDAVDRTVAAG